MDRLNRLQFISTLGLGGAGILSHRLSRNVIQDGSAMDKAIVQEFVGAGHGKVEKVKEMYAENPNLINSAHDWKNGDFETCLGAASHVGHKELASWLIEQGAQSNIFTACLFGRMEIVKPMLDFFPNTLNAKGPHGFTLLHHAIKGGDEALEVKDYLTFLGLKETKLELY